jgi:DnaJ-class molecular chaperone
VQTLNLYSTLGVAATATSADIKKAYRKLAQQLHPDKEGGDATLFKAVQEAYDVLSDAERRYQYDRFGASTPLAEIRKKAEALFDGLLVEVMGVMEGRDEVDMFGRHMYSHNFEDIDLLTTMRHSIEEKKSGQAQEKKVAERHIKRRERALRRLKCRGENDVLTRVLNKQLDHFRQNVASMSERLAVLAEMLVVLDHYELLDDTPAQSNTPKLA